MLLPTLLAVDRFPTLPRVMGVIPGIYFFPTLALGEAAGPRRTAPTVATTSVVQRSRKRLAAHQPAP